LIVAILAMAAMLALGLPALAYVDGQQQASANVRISDSAYNLAEGVLETQVYLLSRSWPGTQLTARPTCSAAAALAGCPDPARIASSFMSPDWAAGASWTTTIRDNGGATPNYYSDAAAATQPSWDANADGRLWVRAQATARARTRTIVALVQVQTVDSSLVFPHNVITAGWFQTTNNGRKVIVDSKGTSAQPAPLAVRCTSREPSCLGYEAPKGQVSPDTTQTGYTGGAALSADRLDTLRTRAIAAATYYASGCPANPSGAIVFIESGNCSYNNSAGPCCNTPTTPGIVVIVNGTLALGGNIEYNGIVYLVNQQNSTEAVLNLSGTSAVAGSVAVDGLGGVLAGSSGRNVTYASSVYNHLQGYGSASIIQNTWREIPS
jgi:hypothetical protein